jgi:hypothetical protein
MNRTILSKKIKFKMDSNAWMCKEDWNQKYYQHGLKLTGITCRKGK